MKKYITKRVLLCLLTFICISFVLYYLFTDADPYFDYRCLENLTGAYINSHWMSDKPGHIFEVEELDIILKWAQTIEPTAYLSEGIIGEGPNIYVINKRGKTGIKLRYISGEDTLIFSNALYSAHADSTLSERVSSILALHSLPSTVKTRSASYGSIGISHNGSERIDMPNRETINLAFEIADLIASRLPEDYNIPQLVEGYECTDILIYSYYSMRIWHDGDTILPKVVLFVSGRPAFAFHLDENDIPHVSRINELVGKYFG